MPNTHAHAPVIRYAQSDDGWGGYGPKLRSTIRDNGLRRVIEIGGGANPSFKPEEVRDLGLDYSLLDISAQELAKAPDGYAKVCADIAAADLDLDGSYDFAFSHMLAEHVHNGENFHRNVLRLLRPGGFALHFFPTMWAPPFVANRLLPEGAADQLLRRLIPGRDRYRQAKFPAYYDWCRGPTRAQIARFERLGYQVQAYEGFYGHSQYYDRVPALRSLHLRWSRYLVKHPVPALTSFASVLLRRR